MTRLEVCNLALNRIGQPSLTAIDDDTKAGRMCRAFIDETIGEVIRVFPWNAAITRAQLQTPAVIPSWARNTACAYKDIRQNGGNIYQCVNAGTSGATGPTGTTGLITDGTASWKWVCAGTILNLSTLSYAYVLPEDCLRVLDLNGDKAYAYRIEGGIIYTNEASGVLRYCRMVDVGEMDPIMVEAVATRLAAKIAFPITGLATIAQSLYQEYAMAVSLAAKISAGEDQGDLVDILQLYTNAQIALKQNSTQG